MSKTPVRDVFRQYAKTTTLHGFKYLYSEYYVDRVIWLVCCCASACCAGVLCAVLWERFSNLPALLALWDDTNSGEYMKENIPAIAICPSPHSLTGSFFDNISSNEIDNLRLRMVLARILTGSSVAPDQLARLEKLLADNNENLHSIVTKYTPTCAEQITKCRYLEFILSCKELFKKEITTWGMCCVMRPKKLHKMSQHFVTPHIIQTLDLVLDTANESRYKGRLAMIPSRLQIVTMYDNEDNIQPNILLSGKSYLAHIRFTAFPGNLASENLMETICVRDEGYSKTACMFNCAENSCGCEDPLHPSKFASLHLPMCNITQLQCVRGTEFKVNRKCNCLPACKQISTYMVLESSPMNVQYSMDPFYQGLDVTRTIIVNVRVNLGHSRIFVVHPTESWLTLLSSLGGVFNMFIGVGLFSALEFLFFMLVKLPIAIKKSSQIDITNAHIPDAKLSYAIPSMGVSTFNKTPRTTFVRRSYPIRY